MPNRTRPMTSLLVFMGVNFVLVSTVTPVYDFVCFLPYWERRVGITNLVWERQRLVSSMAESKVLGKSGSIVFDDTAWVDLKFKKLRERIRKERENMLKKGPQSA